MTEACWQKLCRGWSICINKTIYISEKFPLSWFLMNIQIAESEKGFFKECVNNIHFNSHFSNFSHMLRSRWRIRRYSNLLQALCAAFGGISRKLRCWRTVWEMKRIAKIFHCQFQTKKQVYVKNRPLAWTLLSKRKGIFCFYNKKN